MPESSFNPEWFSRPGDTVAALMEKRGLSVAALVERTGWERRRIRSVLQGAIPINEEIATGLAQHVGGSIEFWTKRQAQFERDLEAVTRRVDPNEARAWLKTLPVKQMREGGWVVTASDYYETLRSSLAFFDVSSPSEWGERYTNFANEFRYRTSATYHSTIGALSAWLRQGELQAAAEQHGDWDPSAFRSALFELRALTRSKHPKDFIPKLREACASLGVAVVFVKALPGCRTSGASRFISGTRAMMILSFRYQSDDHFWFSFFHEAGHLLLHGPGKTFVDGEIAAPTVEEDEANAFAAGMLVPHDKLEEMLRLRARINSIVRFAQRIGVSPGIVVGQMQHHKALGPQQMNGLKRRFSWEQIAEAAT